MAGASNKRRWRLGAPAVVAAALLAVPVLGGSAAAAQAPERLKLDVQRVVIPKDRERLVKRGVSVRAECTTECTLGVAVRLPKRLARDLGLKRPLIGDDSARFQADTARWLRVPINKGAGRRLLAYEGTARILVRVRARP